MGYGYDHSVTIGGRTFTELATEITSKRELMGGCTEASMLIPDAPFDDFLGIEIEDVVIIKWDSTSPWWRGIVVDLDTSSSGSGDGGLRISCSGIARTLLAEVDPVGLFGSTIGLAAPAAVTSAEVSGTGTIGEGLHEYYVFCGDSKGFFFVDSGVSVAKTTTTIATVGDSDPAAQSPEYIVAAHIAVTITNVEKATRYRVYKAFYADMIGAAVGLGHDVGTGGSPTIYHYVDVSNNAFIDDGQLDWESENSVAILPTTPTSILATISDYDVQSVVKHLVDTHYNAGYAAAKITAGDTTNIEELNLNEDDAMLDEILDTLAGLIGDTFWGVDAEGEVYFKPRVIATGSLSSKIVKTFTEGAQLDLATMHTDDITDVLTTVSRSATRDGATEVQIVPTGKTRAELLARRNLELAKGNATALTRWNTAIDRSAPKNDPLRKRMNITSSTPIETDPTTFFSSFASATALEATYPGLGWLYRQRTELGDTKVQEILETIRDKMQPTTARPFNGPRRRGVNIPLRGLRGERDLTLHAVNTMRKMQAATGRWAINAVRVAIEFKPGEHLVAIRTLKGTRYVMEVQEVTVTFGDDCVVSISCGEDDIFKMMKYTAAATMRTIATADPVTIGASGIGSVAVQAAKSLLAAGSISDSLLPAGVQLGRVDPGVLPIPATADHIHTIAPTVINEMIQTDGETLPFMQRLFNLSSALSELDDFIDPTHADFVRGLKFKDGDLAYISSTDKRYAYKGPSVGGAVADEWNEIASGGDVPVTGTDIKTIGTANAAGTGDLFASDDHVHAHRALSVADPQPVGDTAAPGSVGSASDAGHVHVGSDADLSDADPEDVASAAAPGTSEDGSRADHAHKGVVVFFAPIVADLPTPTSGSIGLGFVNSGHGYWYDPVLTDWVCITHMVAPV